MSAKFRTHKRLPPEIDAWLRTVEKGDIPACEEQRLLCEYVRRVFATERLFIDRERLDAYMGYQRFFPFDLSDDEKMVVACFLCTYTEEMMPRWDTLFLYVGRGYGKTGFGAFLTFCMLSAANGVPMYDVDVCATIEEQAKIGYNELYRIMEGNSDLFSLGFDWNKVELKNLTTQSRFKYWSGNSNSKDGMQSGCVWFDEVHAYENSDNMEVFTGGLGKKPDPRRLMTTTDGEVREGPLDEYKDRCEQILHNGVEDNGLFPFMCKLDSFEEIRDESMWPKANPRVLRSKVLLNRYRKDVAEYLNAPPRHPMVPTKRFNLPAIREDVAVTSLDNLKRASRWFDREALRGRECVLGIDYAKTTDMVGACLLFDNDGEWDAVCHGWWCTRSCDAGNVKAPLRDWADQGWLTITDDVEVDPDMVCRWAADAAGELGATIRIAALDNYRLSLMKRALEGIGLDPSLKGDAQQVWLARPSDLMKVQPVIDSAFANGQIAWGDSPLMRWAANNAKLVPAPNNNFTYGKVEPHSRKTDPFMALVHAFTCVDRLAEPYDPGAWIGAVF